METSPQANSAAVARQIVDAANLADGEEDVPSLTAYLSLIKVAFDNEVPPRQRALVGPRRSPLALESAIRHAADVA